MTNAERQKRYRTNYKRKHPGPATLRKQQRRAELEQAMAELIRRVWQSLESPDRRLYPVLYVDPPWRVEPWSRETGFNRSADNHYPTMTLAEIKAFMAKLPAAENCTLFLWIAAEWHDETHNILAAGGFRYRSHCIWVKTGRQAGLGHWFRFKHEVLVVAVRGTMPAPAPGANWESVIEAPWQGHSSKPEIFAEMIAAYYPTCPKLVMFYRSLPDPAAEAARWAKREAAGWFVSG